ncbi:MAG TPA: hypothetical protein VF456_13065 [Vicinamibacterales bacterium]
MDNVLTTFVSDLIDRVHGPFSFRFVLQPLMALLYAARDGLADARAGRPPYFWTMFTKLEDRSRLLREGWKAVTRVVLLGVAMDTIYQLIVFRWIHPLQLVTVVLGLAFLPYVIFRGPIGRIASWWRNRTDRTTPQPFDASADEAERNRARRGHRV